MATRIPPLPFTALVLDAASKALLLAFVPPRLFRVFADHITLEHNPAVFVASEFRAACRVVESFENSQAQAVEVELDLNAAALFKGTRPHITLSCGPAGFPEDSNRIQGGSPLPFALVLFGTVKTVVPK